MKFKSYILSTLYTILMVIFSIALLSAILFDLLKNDHLSTLNIVLATIGIILFGTGLIVSLYNLLTNKRQTLVVDEDGYFSRLFRHGNKLKFIFISGLLQASILFACFIASYQTTGNLFLVSEYWFIHIIGFFLIVFLSGLVQYAKYKRIYSTTD